MFKDHKEWVNYLLDNCTHFMKDYFNKLFDFNEEVLDNLNSFEIEQELKKLAKRRTSDKIILICYEKPGDFCHRHLVSDWFNKNSISCKEFE